MGRNSVEEEVRPSDLSTIGLSRRRSELHKTIQDARIGTRDTRIEAERAFMGKYGLELATFSLIYSDPDLHKNGSTQNYHGTAPFYVHEASESYANALLAALDKQPKMDRSGWLKRFFADLSSVLQFQVPPSL